MEIRNKAGLTQRALATKLNREPSLVAHYELGQRRIDMAEFYWICKACGSPLQFGRQGRWLPCLPGMILAFT
ncbi:MAG: helix-turn-helix domain-containing protein [Desulfobacterales bacterium]|nr:helix-turn-helix domain-containing protein [Desulfobacterales bacterium]